MFLEALGAVPCARFLQKNLGYSHVLSRWCKEEDQDADTNWLDQVAAGWDVACSLMTQLRNMSICPVQNHHSHMSHMPFR